MQPCAEHRTAAQGQVSAGGARDWTVQCRVVSQKEKETGASKGGAWGSPCQTNGSVGGAMRSEANTHRAQWSSMPMPGRAGATGPSAGLSTATRPVPAEVQTSTQLTCEPCTQARARETVGAKAPNSITHSTSRLSLRSWAVVQVMGKSVLKDELSACARRGRGYDPGAWTQ